MSWADKLSAQRVYREFIVMKKVKLSKRLQTIAGFVKDGAGVIDVGTDHGYIPIFLAQQGYPGRIYASDIKKGPLSRAKRFAAEYGVANSIEFVLSDGLSFSNGNGVDTIVIAGMGGENIAQILEATPWIDKTFHLILQPQSKIAELANWLDNNGFAIQDETLVKDAGRIYPVMSVKKGRSRAPFTCAEMYVDRILLGKRDPLLPEYLDRLIKKLEREMASKEKGKNVKSNELYHLKSALGGLSKMLEETCKW